MTQLLQNAVFGTALILAAALLRRALGGRLIPEARLALWAVCLVRLLAPVFPASPLSLWGLLPRAETGSPSVPAPVPDPAPLPGGELGNVPAVNAPAGTAVPAPQPVEPAAFPWEAVVPAVWIGVGLVLAARYVWSWNRTRRAVAQAIPLGRDDPRYGLLPRCARLREGVMDGAPLTFGAARPTVVVPPGLDGGALDCVLAHEAVHAKRRDNLWHYVMAAALVLYWWNPAVWLMSRLLRRDIELACDRAAVKRLGAARRAEYAQTLVALATASDGPAFCQTFGRKAAEERIISVMKFKKTTIFGVVLSLVLVAGVTAAFASAPKAPDEDSTTSTAPAIGIQSVQLDAESGNVTEYTVNLDVLKQNLDRHVAEGTMTQTEADRVWAQAQEFAQGGKELIWSFQGDSGLTLDELHKVCYRDENGNLIPVDPATVASGFIFPAADPVTYHGRSYNRADLSAETLEWLDWYLALSEEEQLAVSYEPAELRGGELPTTEDAGQPAGDEAPAGEQGLTHDPNGTKDSAGAGDDIICSLPTAPTMNCGVEGCTETRMHQHAGDRCIALGLICPVEGCDIPVCHDHDGVTYYCNGAAHGNGVCDGSCRGWSLTAPAPSAAPVRADCYPSGNGHHETGGHHGNGHHETGGHHGNGHH